MAEVFRARDILLDRDVAVKRFFRDAAVPDGDLRRTGEIRLLAALSHPGIVTVFDAGRATCGPDDDFAYLVMEFVPGSTLAAVIADGPLPAHEVADIGAQLSAALGYVHEQGVVHRDVKPANVLLGPTLADGRRIAKLADFGVARLLDGARLTETGTTIGTANYLSPEQATGAPITGASDVYSLGLVLLEALTGAVAFPGYGVESAVVRLSRPPVIPLQLGADWCALLAAMTARLPADRPDISEVRARLGELSGTTPPVAVPAATQLPQVSTAVKPRSARRRVAVIAASVVAAASAAAVLIGAASPTDVAGTPAAVHQHPATRTASPSDDAAARRAPLAAAAKPARKTPDRQRTSAGTIATRVTDQSTSKSERGSAKPRSKAPGRRSRSAHGKPTKTPKPAPKHAHGPHGHAPRPPHSHGPHGPKHGPKPH